ncbi:hypothetical protein OF83DRAFT_1111694 [Amylostereum chailletii]|nr:hypothetical protein OF83DRAFT_1111694 [Amylostereum chailletii]
MPSYNKGDQVEYRPVGGGNDNVAHSTSEITNIVSEEGIEKYTIRNDNTGKETTYQEMNIVGKAQESVDAEYDDEYEVYALVQCTFSYIQHGSRWSQPVGGSIKMQVSSTTDSSEPSSD